MLKGALMFGQWEDYIGHQFKRGRRVYRALKHKDVITNVWRGAHCRHYERRVHDMGKEDAYELELLKIPSSAFGKSGTS